MTTVTTQELNEMERPELKKWAADRLVLMHMRSMASSERTIRKRSLSAIERDNELQRQLADRRALQIAFKALTGTYMLRSAQDAI